VVSSRRAAVGSVPATLAAVLVDGRPWEELSWQIGGRAVVLRSRGGEEELFRIAHGLRREGR
jgi:hypothetical protein